MKLTDYPKVQKVIKVLENIDNALIQCEKFHVSETPEDDIEVLAGGYWLTVSEHSDGSGDKIDLTGCYIAGDVIAATQQNLLIKRQRVIEWLIDHGIEL